MLSRAVELLKVWATPLTEHMFIDRYRTTQAFLSEYSEMEARLESQIGPELESPDFVPQALKDFAARGYERINRHEPEPPMVFTERPQYCACESWPCPGCDCWHHWAVRPPAPEPEPPNLIEPWSNKNPGPTWAGWLECGCTNCRARLKETGYIDPKSAHVKEREGR
jgi:hypothetical protein